MCSTFAAAAKRILRLRRLSVERTEICTIKWDLLKKFCVVGVLCCCLYEWTYTSSWANHQLGVHYGLTFRWPFSKPKKTHILHENPYKQRLSRGFFGSFAFTIRLCFILIRAFVGLPSFNQITAFQNWNVWRWATNRLHALNWSILVAFALSLSNFGALCNSHVA